MNLTTLIFDLDGTLIDSQEDILDAVRVAFESVGKPEFFIDRSSIGLSIKDIARSAFGDSFESCFPAFEKAFRASYDDREHTKTHLYAKTKEILLRLNHGGKKLYLATMKPEKPTRAILKHFGLDVFFRGQFSSNSWKNEKLSKSDLVERVVSIERISRSSAAYVGDHPDDIIAAKANGLISIAALYGYGDKNIIERLQPDISISDISQLNDLA